MPYTIKQDDSRWGKLQSYTVDVDGEPVGTIVPLYKSLDSNRPYAYQTSVELESEALTDDGGYPNEYRTAMEAKAAVADLMRRTGIDPA